METYSRSVQGQYSFQKRFFFFLFFVFGFARESSSEFLHGSPGPGGKNPE